MSDDHTDHYNKVQFSKSINGDLWVFRADSGEDLEEVLKGVAGSGAGILEALNQIATLVVAKGIFTGDAQKVSKEKDKAVDLPPPRAPKKGKIYLDVPFKDKDKAKAAGARWDGDARSWYVLEFTEAVAEWVDGE